MASQQDQGSYDALVQDLVDALVADFLLTDDEVQTLVDSILDGRLETFADAYAAAADACDAALEDDWQPSQEQHDQEYAAALAAATAIAATYASDLAARATAAARAWADAHDGSLEESADPLRQELSAYAEDRATWKPEQVANYETGQGASDGTGAAIDDVMSGDLLDAAGDVIDYSQYYVAILPDTSSSDFCSEYAGRVFTFDDAPSIDFPAHPSCQHYTVVVGMDEALDEGLDLDEPL